MYPLASIAKVRSIAFLYVITNKGIIKLTIWKALLIKLTSLKSAPLDACDFKTLSASKINVGIKRNVTEITIENAPVLIPKLRKGFNKESRPQLISVGFVVSVNRDERNKKQIILNVIRDASINPSS